MAERLECNDSLTPPLAQSLRSVLHLRAVTPIPSQRFDRPKSTNRGELGGDATQKSQKRGLSKRF